MLEKVLTMFDLRSSFDALASAEKLLTANRTRRFISIAPQNWALTVKLRSAGRFGKRHDCFESRPYAFHRRTSA
jgi:hypothetical protein